MSLIEAQTAQTVGECKHKEFSDSLRREEIEGKKEFSASSLDVNAWCSQPLMALFMKKYIKENRDCPDGV
jgi:hypothetical protein